MLRIPRTLFTLAALSLSAACWSTNEPQLGLGNAELAGGPRIDFDLDERPFPNIPFPNDLATRVDAASPTGKRLNVSELGASAAETRVRKALNEQNGFGVFSPMHVSFDAPLDVENLIARHQQLTPDFDDDAIYLVNVDPKSPGYGEVVLLDMGLGNFPITLSRTNNYFALDPRADDRNLLFEESAEEATGPEGQLLWSDDTDDDGVLDLPNTRTPGGEPSDFREVLDFYERETDTLILRPVNPLAPGTTYALVLTDALTGEDGRAVDSPFETVHHLDQSQALEPLRSILPERFPSRFDTDLSQLRFAWTFTTQVPTEVIEAVRAGLYGHGPLDWLSERYPAEFVTLHNLKSEGAPEPMTFKLDALLEFIVPLATDALGAAGTRVIEEAFEDVDYVISGTYLSPHFLIDPKGLARQGNQANDDALFQIDLASGQAEVRDAEVHFICTVPRAQGQRQAPFPVIIYSHAIGSTRFEMLAFAGAMSKFGFATCTIDAAGHGLELPAEFRGAVDALGRNEGLENLADVIGLHRARDLDNDGTSDSGSDYFSADILHSRDMIRQTAIDQMQLIRILRSFDGQRRFPSSANAHTRLGRELPHLLLNFDQNADGQPELAGDFNGDGQVDFGGDRPYAAWGTSLGGIQASVLSGIEPTIVAGASNAGGGGLLDIATRTTIGNVRNGVVLRMMGPLVIGRPVNDGQNTRLDWLFPQGDRSSSTPIALLPALADGDRVVVRNLTREANELVPAHEAYGQTYVRQGSFRVGVAADALSASARRALIGFDANTDVYADLIGCAPTSTCGRNNCGEEQYCSLNETCEPLAECFASFDAAKLRELAPERAELFERRVVTDPRRLGDPIIIDIFGADGELKHRIDKLGYTYISQNLYFPADAPLAAPAEGWGLRRQTPRFRSFMGLSQMLLEQADPAVYAAHYFKRPLNYPYESEAFRVGGTNFLAIGTLGDQTVPISAAIAIARAAGVVEVLAEDPRYGMPENQFLIENFVYEGIANLDRFPSHPGTLFDPDNLDGGKWRRPDQPDNITPKPVAETPLRATVQTDYGTSALRFGYLSIGGEHTFNAPRPEDAFDIHTFLTNQVGWFLATGGKTLSDDHCLEKMPMTGCEFFDRSRYENPL
ncbi:hypothetical protein DL240_05860 [Lujinxingia litoralis]|uniref:Bacterial virulence factor lipase N-terminal domain-containing protein n=1 Tax=Lujinxingia litoralis TaxID=2211119 RepID=A0A328C757_9DELT|nr:hypothetical protein [Lujinxingia litoralis]RAL23683.1 hypothetical protein DL240_05860 [Lujinxingia litoralis]